MLPPPLEGRAGPAWGFPGPHPPHRLSALQSGWGGGGTGPGTCRQPLPSGLITSTCAQSFEALRLPVGGGRGRWGADAGNGCRKEPAGLN